LLERYGVVGSIPYAGCGVISASHFFDRRYGTDAHDMNSGGTHAASAEKGAHQGF